MTLAEQSKAIKDLLSNQNAEGTIATAATAQVCCLSQLEMFLSCQVVFVRWRLAELQMISESHFALARAGDARPWRCTSLARALRLSLDQSRRVSCFVHARSIRGAWRNRR